MCLLTKRKWRYCISGSCSHKPLTCTCGRHMNWVLQSFPDVLLRPGSDFHHRIMSVFNALLSEDVKVTRIQYCFSTLSQAHRDSSGFKSILMILCTVKDEMIKVFAIWATLFWNNGLQKQFIVVWSTSAHLHSWETLGWYSVTSWICYQLARVNDHESAIRKTLNTNSVLHVENHSFYARLHFGYDHVDEPEDCWCERMKPKHTFLVLGEIFRKLMCRIILDNNF